MRNREQDGLFALRQAEGRARWCILASECLKAIYTAFTTGVFLTGFLLNAGMDSVRIGLVTSLPLLAGVLYPLSPLLLERFRRRKVLLGTARLFYHILVILSVTLLPGRVSDDSLLWWMAAALLLGNGINILVASGFPAWHIGFLPEGIRGRFFAVSGIVNSIFTALATFAASLLADAARASGNQLYRMRMIRLAAFGMALIELILLLLPREPEYPRSSVKGWKLLTLPFGNRKFCMTMITVFAWMMVSTMTLYSANAYLLQEVGVSYVFLSVLQALNIVTTAVIMPFWHRLLLRTSWLRAFQKVFLLFSLYPFLHMLVTGRTYLWLLPVTMIVYQMILAGGTLYFNNMAYLFTPKENRTAYLSWYLMLVSAGSLCGQGLSALLLRFWPEVRVMGSITVTAPQRILFLQGLLSLGFGFWFKKVLLRRLEG
ncbi:MAG: MFS transporter [Roseburia sp.]|nr:MFS transporter [Roseburia sp.]MCM1098252.1 MFS transporter [Ruminococcus flavefaciens]